MNQERQPVRWFARISKVCGRNRDSTDVTESIDFGVRQVTDDTAPWAMINWPVDWHGRCKLELASDHWDLLPELAPVLKAFSEDAAHRLRKRIHKPISPDEVCALLVLHGFVEADSGSHASLNHNQTRQAPRNPHGVSSAVAPSQIGMGVDYSAPGLADAKVMIFDKTFSNGK